MAMHEDLVDAFIVCVVIAAFVLVVFGAFADFTFALWFSALVFVASFLSRGLSIFFNADSRHEAMPAGASGSLNPK